MNLSAPFLIPFAIFIAVFSSVWALAHYYLYKRLTSVFEEMSKGALFVIELMFVLLGMSFPASYVLAKLTHTPFVSFAYRISSIWMGILFYLLLFTIAAHIVGIILRQTELWDRLESAFDFSIPRAGLLIVIVSTAATSAFALYEASRPPKITRLDIPIKNLPYNLDGFKIVQIADLHLGINVGRKKLERVVEKTNLLEPDLVVITGDLMESEALHMPTLLRPLRWIKSRYGVFAVTGNHEYYTFKGVDKVIEAVSRVGVKYLQNKGTRIVDGLMLFGINDPDAKISEAETPPVEELMEKVVTKNAKSNVNVLLAHRASGFQKAAELGVDLMLGSHTHRGQMWPVGFMMELFFPHIYGHFKLGDHHLYVTCGVGTWGPPMRLGAPPEIVFITLRRAR